MGDITSPALLKLKAVLFLVIAALCAGLLASILYPVLTWQIVALFALCVWACCRAYYFCFYVMEHYADPNFKYAGLLDLLLYLTHLKRNQPPK